MMIEIEIDNVNRKFNNAPNSLKTFIFVDDCNYTIITFAYEYRYIGYNNNFYTWWIIDLKENTISLNEIYTHLENIKNKYYNTNIFINESEILQSYFKNLNVLPLKCNIEAVLPFAKGILKDDRLNVPLKFKEKINDNLKNYTFENQNSMINCLLHGLSNIKFEGLNNKEIEHLKLISNMPEVCTPTSKYESINNYMY